jgi:transcriptional regulator with XRE-family HTH domain
MSGARRRGIAQASIRCRFVAIANLAGRLHLSHLGGMNFAPSVHGGQENRTPSALAVVRFARGLSQRELALRAGVCKRTVANAEHGRHAPHPRTAAALSAALGLTAADVFPSSRSIQDEGPARNRAIEKGSDRGAPRTDEASAPPQRKGPPVKLTPTETVVAAVQANGGACSRAEVMRVVAVQLSVVRARDAVHLSVAGRYLDHDPETDTLSVPGAGGSVQLRLPATDGDA